MSTKNQPLSQTSELGQLIAELRSLGTLLAKLVELQVEEKRPKITKRDVDIELRAILLLTEIGPQIREIARSLGLKNHQALYRWPKFMKYYRAMPKRSQAETRRGFQTTEGVEAIDA